MKAKPSQMLLVVRLHFWMFVVSGWQLFSFQNVRAFNPTLDRPVKSREYSAPSTARRNFHQGAWPSQPAEHSSIKPHV